MKKSSLILLSILGLVVLLGIWGVSAYNSLVRDQEAIDGQWAQVENQLQRRSDLIPNLVSTVKGYAQHEEEVFTAIAEARAKLNSGTVDDRVKAAGEFESALARLLVIVEQYPQLKADTQFQKLMDELTGTENRLSIERMRFNEAVKLFNTKVKQFPMVIFARLAGFEPRAYFEVPEGAKQAPQVNFSK
ncbi:MAG: LemA family protein [Candidatus Fermentithermobacillus carboniphilus]|uniref:LemA family protein n=1 Tax=Candidatus Fermentithermobacillus carboniphilus TaxID=3085328 RepID=A0AAT9LDN1_9FIRM|nr:MAG: LemA family protein [Candidatus Fermentithermobacillus carboniphilus]